MFRADDEFQRYPVLNGWQSENLKDYMLDVGCWVLRWSDAWAEFLKLSLVELRMVELSKDERYTLIFTFFEASGYNIDGLQKKLLANRRYESVSRKSWTDVAIVLSI